MTIPILTVRLAVEQDVVAARQRARMLAALLGFDGQEQTRIATAVSEVVRNAVMYAGGGRVDFSLDGETPPQTLVVRIVDTGGGINRLNDILLGRYQSTTGMGIGIQGAQRLMDKFHIETSDRGTTVTMSKTMPRRARALRPSDLPPLLDKLAASGAHDAYGEIHEQNRELLETLDELRRRSEELRQLNRELEDTNRGVVALYAELDEKAEHLRRADELKSTFLFHMSHEFRTPLNSILALSRILLSRLDGPLTQEQEKQVGFIGRAAQELTDMVNDLLDLAKVESGKIEIYAAHWQLGTLFGTLRGMLRPLVLNSPVQLVFEDPPDMPVLFTDEAKVAQILRNFISNALKFTETGEVRVTGNYEESIGAVSITVSDTGIGIAPADQARIFEQFVQVDSARQRQVKGTGLGLPLSLKLAKLLGGGITMQSTPGEGSKFTLTIPANFGNIPAPIYDPLPAVTGEPPPHRPTVLIVDDEEMARYLIRKALSDLDLNVEEARSGAEGLTLAVERSPNLIVLDLAMPEMDGIEVLAKLRANPATHDLPVVIHTSRKLAGEERDWIYSTASAFVAKGASSAVDLRVKVEELVKKGGS